MTKIQQVSKYINQNNILTKYMRINLDLYSLCFICKLFNYDLKMCVIKYSV